MSDSKNRPFVIPIFLPNAGCTYRCTFCDQVTITGETTPFPSKEKVQGIIRQFLEYRGNQNRYTQISFYGGNFLGLPEAQIDSLLGEATRYVLRGDVDGLRFSTRPDSINKKQLRHLQNFPVTTIELGVQSMDDGVLRRVNRGHLAKDTCHAVSLLKKRGYEIGLQMMVGLPGDSTESALDSARQMGSLAPDFVRIYPTVVLAGSQLADQYEKGKYIPMTLASCITLVKQIYIIFDQHRIPVVRMGLQASDAFDDPKKVLAGPYHPAFGHLVLSELFLDKAISLLSTIKNLPNEVSFRVHPNSIPRLRGLKNQNLARIKRQFSIRRLHIIPDNSLNMKDLVVSS